MAQYEMSLRDYQRIILKRKSGIIMFVILGAVLTFAFAKKPERKYRAVSKIRVVRPSETGRRLIDLLSGAAMGDDISTHQVRVTGQKTLIAVAHRLHLLPDFVQAKDVERAIKEDFDKPQVAATVMQLKDRIKVEREGQTNILTITVEAPTAEEACKIANTVADVYSERANMQKNRQLADLQKYITQQLQAARDALLKAQRKLQEKRREFLGEGIDKASYGSLATERNEAQQQHELLQEQIKMLEHWREADKGAIISASAGKAGNAVIDNLNKELVALQLKRHDLLVYHTEQAPQVKDVDARIASVIKRLIGEMKAIDDRLKARIAFIDKVLAESPKVELELAKAENEVAAAKAARDKWADAMRDAEIRLRDTTKTVFVEEHAAAAEQVRQASKWVLVIVGGLVGLIFGFLYAVVVEVLDTSIDTIDDVEELLDTPVRGVIPHVDLGELKELMRESNPDLSEDQLPDRPILLATQLGPKSATAEAFRTLRTNLDFEMGKRQGRSLAITSAALGEGKTSCACNLAVAFAQNGKRTILVDADLRRPGIYRAFGLEKQPGFSEVLQGRLALQEAVRTISDVFLGNMGTENVLRTPGLENLHILTCGGTPANPSELLSQEQARKVMEELKNSYDVVLVDCPPVLPVADAVILSTYLDGVVLVYQVGKIARGVLKRAKFQLDNVGASVWGVVLNDLAPEVSEFKDAHYYRAEHYYMKEESGRRRGWLSRAFGRSGG